MLPVHTILHPTDFSEPSQYAFRLACALARDYGARLILLHVAEAPPVFYGEGAFAALSPEDLQALCAKIHRLQPHDRGIAVERRLAEGDAAAEIVRVAQETNSDVILMGTHGRTGLGRLFMGSVAEQVLRRAPCPVITAKASVRAAPVTVPDWDEAEMLVS